MVSGQAHYSTDEPLIRKVGEGTVLTSPCGPEPPRRFVSPVDGHAARRPVRQIWGQSQGIAGSAQALPNSSAGDHGGMGERARKGERGEEIDRRRQENRDSAVKNMAMTLEEREKKEKKEKGGKKERNGRSDWDAWSRGADPIPLAEYPELRLYAVDCSQFKA